MTHTSTQRSQARVFGTDSPQMPDAVVLADFITAGVSIVCPRPELGALCQVAVIAAALGLPPSTEIPDGARVGTSSADTVGQTAGAVTTLADLTTWLASHHCDPDTTPLVRSDDFFIEVGILGVEGTACGEHTYARRALLIYTDPECLMFCVPPAVGARKVADRFESLTGEGDNGGAFADALAQLRDERYPATAIVDGIIDFCRDLPTVAIARTDVGESP